MAVLFLITGLAGLPAASADPGRVYIQICSDTSTGGLNTASHYNPFPSDDYSYTSPTGQAALVMAESYRDAHRDSLGNPIKLTWYMNCGSMYSCGTKTGPLLPYELMIDNHGASIARWGDEMAYHYHTWIWSDPESDGVFSWNQAPVFAPCLSDFEQVVARFVIDRGFYPTSFRSGWNVMDVGWECYLDDWYPYRFEGTKPSGLWVPYHPSAADYRLVGDLRGWESSYDYTPSLTAAKVEAAFLRAANGESLVMTLYSHLKETDFPDRIADAHSLFTSAHEKYPGVEFEYLTARECMLRWRNGTDVAPPAITVSASDSDGVRTAIVSTDEEIYQRQPFVGIRKLDGAYSRIDCTPFGTNRWSVTYPLADTVAAGVGMTDWFGNSAVKLLPVVLRILDLVASPTTTTAEITWNTGIPADARVECSLASSGTAVVVSDPAMSRTHRVSLTGLLPGRVYRLKAASRDEGGQVAGAEVGMLTIPMDPVVIDNSDPGFSVTGTWTTGTTATGKYGADYRYAGVAPTGTSHADWVWTPPNLGHWNAYAWWSAGSNRSTAAPYSVTVGGVTYPVTMDQQVNGGQWNLLGTYDVSGGSIGVRLGNSAPSGYVVIADAVRFEPAFTQVYDLGLARLLPDGTAISLSGLTVTAVFDGYYYVQEPDRSSGIRVLGSGVSEGQMVDVSGSLATVDGERAIDLCAELH